MPQNYIKNPDYAAIFPLLGEKNPQFYLGVPLQSFTRLRVGFFRPSLYRIFIFPPPKPEKRRAKKSPQAR
jgi:hypothetical protein